MTTKYLIKDSIDEIHILSSEKDALIYPNGIQDPPNQANYEEWGMNGLDGYSNEIDKVVLQMEDNTMLETGRVLNRTVNKNDFNINSLAVADNELTLIKSGGITYTFNELGEWEDVGLQELLNKLDFDEHGIADLSLVPANKWAELADEFEVLIFTEDLGLDKFVEITTDPFAPIEWVSKFDFEVLMWTDVMNLEEPPKIEITVPHFRPLDKLDNQFSIVMGEYTPE